MKQPSSRLKDKSMPGRVPKFYSKPRLASLVFAIFITGVISDPVDSTRAQAMKTQSNEPRQASLGNSSSAVVAITGLVRQPLHFGLKDLDTFNSVSVRQVDHRTAGFFGNFRFRGVPLASLLSLTTPETTLQSWLAEYHGLVVCLAGRTGGVQP